MFFRAWRRVLNLAFSRPGGLIGPNLAFSVLVLALSPLWAAAYVLGWPPAVLGALRLFSAGWIWLATSLLCYGVRDALEGRATPLKAMAAAWWRARVIERSLSFFGLALAAAWIAAGLYFYGGWKDSPPWARAGTLVVALAGLVLALATALDLGLSSRTRVHWKGEWKAALLMPFAFWPSCLAGALSVVLLSGSLVVVAGGNGWAGRLLGAPVFLLPVAGAAVLAAFLDALSDEFLARSMGVPEPDAGMSLKEWLRPWE